jgi:acyl carrier protein
MKKDEVNEAIVEALEIEAHELDPSKKLDDYENYDSLALLTLMSLLEDGGVEIESDDLDSIECVSDIYRLAGV